jgi:hypothetical protein
VFLARICVLDPVFGVAEVAVFVLGLNERGLPVVPVLEEVLLGPELAGGPIAGAGLGPNISAGSAAWPDGRSQLWAGRVGEKARGVGAVFLARICVVDLISGCVVCDDGACAVGAGTETAVGLDSAMTFRSCPPGVFADAAMTPLSSASLPVTRSRFARLCRYWADCSTKLDCARV